MKLSELIERFERARANIRPTEAEQMYAELCEVLNNWDVVDKHTCALCGNTGIARVITSPPHVAPARYKEIQCPQGCNADNVAKILEASRKIMMQETQAAIKPNITMPPNWPGSQNG